MPVKLTAMTFSHCAALVSSSAVPEKVAALFTITSSRPWRATVLPTIASMSSQLATSVFSKCAEAPLRAISSRVGLAALERLRHHIGNDDAGPLRGKADGYRTANT